MWYCSRMETTRIVSLEKIQEILKSVSSNKVEDFFRILINIEPSQLPPEETLSHLLSLFEVPKDIQTNAQDMREKFSEVWVMRNMGFFIGINAGVDSKSVTQFATMLRSGMIGNGWDLNDYTSILDRDQASGVIWAFTHIMKKPPQITERSLEEIKKIKLEREFVPDFNKKFAGTDQVQLANFTNALSELTTVSNGMTNISQAQTLSVQELQGLTNSMQSMMSKFIEMWTHVNQTIVRNSANR